MKQNNGNRNDNATLIMENQTSPQQPTINSPKRLARIAGVLYLFVGIFGGFSEGFVDPKIQTFVLL